MNLKNVIRSFPDFPKKGVIFRDITPILKRPEALDYTVQELKKRVEKWDFDVIVGIESRGFIFGSVLAHMMGKSFVPVRKEGKLPGETIKLSYSIEYGSATIEMQKDAIEKGQRVLVVDDLLATGGTARATAKLVEKLGGTVVGFAFVIELADLKGREQLKGYQVCSLVVYE